MSVCSRGGPERRYSLRLGTWADRWARITSVRPDVFKIAESDTMQRRKPKHRDERAAK